MPSVNWYSGPMQHMPVSGGSVGLWECSCGASGETMHGIGPGSYSWHIESSRMEQAVQEPSETVVITTKNDTTLRGVLVARTPDGFVLRAASVMQTRGGEDRWQSLVGDTVVPLEQVDYWQRSLPIEVLEALK